MSQPSIIATLHELFLHVPPRRCRQLGPVLGLVLATRTPIIEFTGRWLNENISSGPRG